mgnify:CR=1 FL=1
MRYQDFVIKDGHFIGHFDKMYQDSDTIPWNQDVTASSIAATLDAELISYLDSHYNFTSAIDIGCGLGYLTNRIFSESIPSAYHRAVDISPTAIRTAKRLFPDIRFDCMDIAEPVQVAERSDLAIGIELHWYLLDAIEVFRDNLGKLADHVYIRQSLPHHSGYLGENTFPTLNAISHFWGAKYDIIMENRIRTSPLGAFISIFAASP